MNSITTTDPEFHPNVNKSFVERIALNFIIDERDYPFVKLTLTMMLTQIPFAIFLFIPGMFRWWMAPIYLAICIGYFLGPFILMLHNTSHRPLFKSKYKIMNNFIPWVIGIFYGESPETYYAHHLGMHHVEDNMENDLSSTLKFNGDNFWHFHQYFFTFFFAGLIQLWIYFTKRKRFNIRNWMTTGEAYFLAICAVTLYFNWQASLVVFIIPFFIARYGMMAGNWGQHSFVDMSDPTNNYKNTITCINAAYNQKCFNDGYHIGHHLKANRHWTDMPRDFRDNVDQYIANKAVVFQKIDFFLVWFFLMTKNYKALAKNFIQLDSSKKMSEDEIIAFLKSRTNRV